MKTQKLLVYIFKWFALIFLSILVIKGNNAKILAIVLIGYITVILIFEGYREFKIKDK